MYVIEIACYWNKNNDFNCRIYSYIWINKLKLWGSFLLHFMEMYNTGLSILTHLMYILKSIPRYKFQNTFHSMNCAINTQFWKCNLINKIFIFLEKLKRRLVFPAIMTIIIAKLSCDKVNVYTNPNRQYFTINYITTG